MASLYGDEDFPLGAVLILRQLGHDVQTVSEAGHCGGDDSSVLSDASADGRAVLTHNHNHFRRLHRTVRPHAGIISCTRDDQDLAGLAQRIPDAIDAAPTLADQFIRVVRPNPSVKP